jgi:uncharacterized protein YpbB
MKKFLTILLTTFNLHANDLYLYDKNNDVELTEVINNKLNVLSTITGKTYTMGIEQLLLENATKRGIEKRDIEIVLSMNEDGFEIHRIAKITKLSIEQVEKILKENGRNGLE